MKFVTLSLVFLFGLSAFAIGNEKGNGGFVLSCPEKPIRLFDFYEAENLYKFKPLVPSDDIAEEKIVAERIQQIALKDSGLAKKLTDNLNYFFLNLKMLPDYIGPSADTQHVFVPAGCHLIQAALQRKALVSARLKFYLAQNIWNQLSKYDRAGLILHEILYMSSEQKDSRFIRRLTGFIFSQELAVATTDVLREEFKNAGWDTTL